MSLNRLSSILLVWALLPFTAVSQEKQFQVMETCYDRQSKSHFEPRYYSGEESVIPLDSNRWAFKTLI
jgi:hypothetical protein